MFYFLPIYQFETKKLYCSLPLKRYFLFDGVTMRRKRVDEEKGEEMMGRVG